MTDQWDRTVDVLVAGSGAAGLTAAIAAADAGLEVLVAESTARWGGTTSVSGGGLWMPANPLMLRDGVADSTEEALRYINEVVAEAGPASSPERRKAYVQTAPEVVAFLGRKGVRWRRSPDYPDYYPDRPGGKVGRAIEAAPFDTKLLGDFYDSARSKESGIPLPLMTDDVWLLSRAWSTPSGFVRGTRFVFRSIGHFAAGRRPAGIGGALAASLMHIVRGQQTPVWLSAPVTDLVTEDGDVVGAVIEKDGRKLRIRARRAVVLAAGGFARNTEWRRKHHGIPGYSSAPEGDLGTAIEAGTRAGAALALMDDAWWGASLLGPDGKTSFLVSERSFPFSIIIDANGERFTNESASYIDVGHAMLEHDVPGPMWMVSDVRHSRRYLNSALMGQAGKWIRAGLLIEAPTLEELAAEIGVDPARLGAAVQRFNGFARTGVDADFGRGRTVYDNYYGDPRVKPNPNLGPLEKGPFRAVRVHPGDLGTKGGLLTDEHARVLREDGTAIGGLYAAGNTTASVMGRTYPGPGSTIGPAVVFGYRAARHAAAH
ncbi:FAD-dependent oxidoreductase [Planomonospora venezuelensis]|uniref:3-oxosteroid 1-dehydrogenase n=1 Tax=Planomonospora venezuelensis TaxID=1999 RepID=A0A841DCD4_PLAVE|nr:FAD-dependent oxidoreductase [Planomonospora venezuelensis]MBB5967149.1 3-oxosteroid 1-dehydrogenase [Planomonospora venezuelensis]GIN02918.1 3-oxosteroid 1-dehydrogenase [Planomonospora venezuelensis]